MNSQIVCRGIFAALALVATPAYAAMESWEISTRHDKNDEIVKLVALADLPEQPPSKIIIHMNPLSTAEVFKRVNDGFEYISPTQPITRIRQRLLSAGVALLSPNAASDTSKLDTRDREQREHAIDMAKLAEEAKRRYPAAKVYVAGYSNAASSVVTAAAYDSRYIDGYIVIGGDFRGHRATRLSGVSKPGLIFHALSHKCDSAPMLEAEEIAQKTKWSLVRVGYSRPDKQRGCFTNYQNALVGLDADYSKTLLAWMAGEGAPKTLGLEKSAVPYSETLHAVPAGSRNIFGRNSMEMTLFVPPGTGPFPVVIFSHGDVEYDPIQMGRERRFRDMVMAREFLALGFAVAQAARPGVGRSSGNYLDFGRAGSASDALMKGRAHGEEALAVYDYLKTLPELNAEQVILAGQSAGGFASSVLGASTPMMPWLKAIINFSGGRTTVSNNEVATGMNNIMVGAFRELGKTSQLPQLWIFAENDSRYSAETIRASYQAFTESGGLATLVLRPPSEKADGHFIYHEPEKWRDDLKAFLQKAGQLPAPR